MQNNCHLFHAVSKSFKKFFLGHLDQYNFKCDINTTKERKFTHPLTHTHKYQNLKSKFNKVKETHTITQCKYLTIRYKVRIDFNYHITLMENYTNQFKY